MVDKTPAQITSGTANDASVVHASDASLANLSRSHTERDISRLQGTAPLFSASKTYAVNDLVTESGIVYRNIVAIAVPAAFNPTDWQAIQTPWTSDIDAAGNNLLDFGYLESNAVNPADAGTLRLGNNEAITARNAGNTANLGIIFDSDDNISTSSPINGLGGIFIFKSSNVERFRLTTTVVDFTAKIQTDSTTTTAGYRDLGFTTDPSSASAGDLYYNTTNNKYRSYNGATWDELGGAASQTPWTSDIDADTFNLLNSGYLEQNEITEPGDPASGLLRLWSESDAGFSVLRYKGNNGIVNTISQDVFVPVRNVTGGTLLKGKVVHVTGAQGQRITVALAKADSDSTMRGIGFLLEDLNNNSNGFVIVAGTERNINTNAFSAGDTLYVSETTAGEVTTTPPAHPNISQVVGFVLVSNPTTGEINVIPGDTNGQEEGTNKNSFLVGDGLTGTKELGFVDDTGTQTITTDTDGININVKTAGNLEILVGATVRVTADDDDVSVTNLNLLMDGGYIELTEIAEPTAPAADKAKLWLDPSVIINDHPRLALTDENGVVFDLSSAGIIVNTYNTEAIGNNHYLALSGLNTSNGTFINRAIVLPRSSRFYNMYVVVTTNGTTINTTCTLVDAAASPTVLEVDIPLGTTGTFFNTDDFVDIQIGTEVAYQFSLTTGGTLAIASVGMATDILRLVD